MLKTVYCVHYFLSFMFQTKLLSVLQHCTNQHQSALSECDHGPLEEDRDKPWLSPSGPEMAGLRKIILDRRFLNTMHYYTSCQ